MAADDPLLQLHIEPQQPIQIEELTAALGSLARQYRIFAKQEGMSEEGADAKLLVSAVKPGSIDILFSPDWQSIAGAAATVSPLFTPLIDKVELIQKFADRIKKLIDLFSDKKDSASVSVVECTDAANIVKPTAENGGVQTFTIIKGDMFFSPTIVLDTRQARNVIENATKAKSAIEAPQGERRQRVSMIWSRLDRDEAKTGKRSPDRVLIEEIDPKPRPVLFTDEMSYLKHEMIADEENPLQKVYFVDVEVSRTQGKVTAYRIVGYHGKDDL